MPETVTVYYDYLCPYAWRGAELAEMVAGELELEFRWRHFSLYQSKVARGAHGQLWNSRISPDDESGGRGLLPFMASCAARRQGLALYRAFRLAAMRAHHQQCRPYTFPVLLEVAEAAGLHMPTFEQDLANPERRTLLANEHHQAASLNVVTTPTFRFASGHMGELRLAQVPARREDAVQLFLGYRDLLESYPYLEAVQRPRAISN